jgi:hypothetical protein
VLDAIPEPQEEALFLFEHVVTDGKRKVPDRPWYCHSEDRGETVRVP